MCVLGVVSFEQWHCTVEEVRWWVTHKGVRWWWLYHDHDLLGPHQSRGREGAKGPWLRAECAGHPALPLKTKGVGWGGVMVTWPSRAAHSGGG